MPAAAASAPPAPRVGPQAPATAGVNAPGDNRVAYRIHARLDDLEGEAAEGLGPDRKQLSGSLELDWTNGQAVPTQELWFHLYLNAFSNNRSTHLWESKGDLRGTKIEDEWGWSRVQTARVARPGEEPVDVSHTLRYVQPDDGRIEDRTVFVIDLPFAVAPGESVSVFVDWDSLLPRVRRRTGTKEDFLLVAQWFPKLGVFEGERGWNCHQFHMNTEFYADYGTYEVTLDLPQRYEGKVGGSGVMVEPAREIRPGRIEVQFIAPAQRDQRDVDRTGKRALVHDFTWTGDPRYVVKGYTFRFQEWADDFPGEVERARELLGPTVDLTLRDVDVTVLIHPEREAQAYRHFKATSAALFFYGLWFGEYPYQHVTVVNPAYGAGGAGGMEYPTLFTCGTNLFTTEDTYTPESVTVHECGHQFWYGLVGNNEFEAAWMDEGFNSFTDSEVLWRVYGPSRSTTRFAGLPVDGVPVGGDPLTAKIGEGRAKTIYDAARGRSVPMPFDFDLEPLRTSGFLDYWRSWPSLSFVSEWSDPRQEDRGGYLRAADADPIDTFAWRYRDSGSYRTNSYPRTAVALRSLGAVIGYDKFLQGMRHYAADWRYRHPYPDDFFASFQEGAETDCQWYFDELFRGVGTVDWSVTVDQVRVAEPKGFFQRESGEFIAPPAAADVAEEGEKHKQPWRTEVLLKREGTLRLPLPVRLTWEGTDGGDPIVEEQVWTREEQGEATWKRLVFESERKLLAVELDPDHGFYIDGDRSNDAWFDRVDAQTPWRWGERALVRFQRLLFWMGGIGG